MITPLSCEIYAPSKAKAEELSRILNRCAKETSQSVILRSHRIPRNERRSTPTITLNLPVEAASTQHLAWCLTCRLTCFCPDVRVSVLVLGSDAFRSEPANTGSHLEAPTSLWA